MKITQRRRHRLLGTLGLALVVLSGCQTYYGGMTVPSGRYLEHTPTYIPDSPPFPFAREVASQQAIAAEPEPGAPLGLPPRVPAGPLP